MNICKLVHLLLFILVLTFGLKASGDAAKTSGAQYIIITPDDPDFVDKLQILANFRQDQGISTVVVTTTEIGGSSVIDITNYLKEAYYTWDTPPIAVMLVGDDNKIPSPSYPGGNNSKNDISDNFYADMDGDDLPDIAISRLPFNSYSFLSSFINRIINYETNPPVNTGYYLNPITSMAWNSNSDNMICAEAANGFFSNNLDKEPVRINAIFEGEPGNEWQCDMQFYDLFGPDGLNYVPISPSYLTDWSGDATQINNSLTSGAFLILNLDNGTEYGWSKPEYWSENLYELYIADPFFMISINSLNGKFNWSFDVFTESLLKHPNGSIGVIASTMNLDPLYPGIYFTYLMDALWEDFLPYYYQDFTNMDLTLPAFANLASKHFLGNLSNAEKIIYSFHYFGEPFCPIIYEQPTEMEISHSDTFIENTGYFEVLAPENAMICLSVNHEIYAVETGTGSLLSIPIEALSIDDTLIVTITKQNFLRYSNKVIYETNTHVNEKIEPGSKIAVYPNPATDQIMISLNSDLHKINQISILNTAGEVELSTNRSFEIESVKQIQLTGLKKGMYLLFIESDSSIFVRKFIITN